VKLAGKKIKIMDDAAPKGRPATQKVSSSSIIIHPERCTGCGACEDVCSLKRTGRKDPEGSAIRVARTASGSGYVPLTCAVCPDAVCVSVCPGDVLSRNEKFGAVTLRPEGCSSCGGCVLSCPFEVLHMGEGRYMPWHCDLCEGAPECAKACPSGALEAVGRDDKRALARIGAAAREIARLLGDVE
jgi:anaerobic carbon-monoxide dehydrogenase iron sulfur subunit